MSGLRNDVEKLLAWYTERARPFIASHASTELAAIDQQKLRTEQLVKAAGEEEVVCFLGASGVGKSTLLNALVSERYNLLPHGGIGPLTAQAALVRYAEVPYLRADYLPASALNKILFALERAHESAIKRAPASDAISEIAGAIDEEDRREAEAALPVFEPDALGEGATDKLEAYQRQVRLLIQGEQQGVIDLPYLTDALRAVLGYAPRWGMPASTDDLARIQRLRSCLALTRNDGVHYELRVDGDVESFLRDLRDHASGFLAPLIKRLEVGWNAKGLREGLVLVDLPGVGVANDEYRSVTTEWIREKARAIVLVVDSKGVTESSADLLRSTGFLNRLLHDSHDPTAEPVILAVAVAKVDQSADSAWQDERALRPGAARKWNEHFDEICRRAIELVRGQMRQELDKLVAAGPDATRTEREQALERVLDTLQIHPVSAVQYRLFHLQDEEDRPRIKSAEESRIPGFFAALRETAEVHRNRSRARAGGALDDFRHRVRTVLTLVQTQWEENLRAEQEAQQLREELETFLAPRQRELESRQGAFREFLRESIPTEIDLRVAKEAETAKADITQFLRKLESFHWATLRAAVRRGGTYESRSGRHIDLPNELALRFEEPIAVVWSKHILTSLRKRTTELGKNYVGMVGEVVDWARGQNARVQPRFIEALHANLIAQTKELASVGKEAVDELQKKVTVELYRQLVKRIRQRCERFVEDKKDAGPGVKQRILGLFNEELAGAVVEIAAPIARDVLRTNYNGVQQEISDRFAAYHNPLQTARETIVQSHEDGVRRSDAQRRRHVLAEIDAILVALPEARA
jgi:predicted GTPase